MPREYKVFHGVGVVVAEVKSHTMLSVLAITTGDPVDFSVPARRFDVDLTRTPGRGAWGLVQFDDRGVKADGKPLEPLLDCTQLRRGITTIGSGPAGAGQLDDQTRGAFVGAVYIEHGLYGSLYDAHIACSGAWPPSMCSLAEITSIAYSSNTAANGSFAGKRYLGFKATVDSTSPLTVTFSRTPNTQVVVDLSGTDFDSAPPPEAYGDIASLATDSQVNEGVLFVELTYAATLGLVDPKIPIGLDGYAPPAPSPDPPDNPPPHPPQPSPGPAPMQRINISLVHPDATLNTVLDEIVGEVRVAGAFPSKDDRNGLFGVVSRMSKPAHPVAIDLIAHAQQGVLQFGTWVIDSNEQVSTLLLKEWKKRSPHEIRLLGCNTARTVPGQAAMRHLKEVFSEDGNDVSVYGATVPLYARDFGPQGLISTNVLVECEAMPPPLDTVAPGDIVDSWFDRFQAVQTMRILGIRDALRAMTIEEIVAKSTGTLAQNRRLVELASRARDIDALFAGLAEGIVTAPGLLEIPDSEQLYPAGSRYGEAVFHRVTSFFGGAMFRLYPKGFESGILVRRRSPALA